MTALYCPRCEGEVQIPALPAAQRDEIARLRYGSSTVEAYEKLSELSGLDLRLAKRLVITSGLTEPLSNMRLKLAARVDCGMNLSSARRSLSAIR